MKTLPKIFISVPDDKYLNENRKAIKRAIANYLVSKQLQPVGFEPEQFGIQGIKKNNIDWTFEKADKVISQCDGVMIIGLARTFFSKIDFSKYDNELSNFSEKQKEALRQMVITGNKDRAIEASGLSVDVINKLLENNTAFWEVYTKITKLEEEKAFQEGSTIDILETRYNHVEGAIALTRKLPTLLLWENGIERSGIFNSGIKTFVIPNVHTVDWVEEQGFGNHFKSWNEDISFRRDVFLGYCSEASDSAVALRGFMETQGFTVLDWSRDFKAAGPTIIDEIERAATLCRCAVFLFTESDELQQNATANATYKTVPRDNVLAETGYFMRNMGKERVAIIREGEVKMPADFGGIIYLFMEDRTELSNIKISLERFLLEALKINL